MMDSTYWGGIKDGLAQIGTEKPQTFDEVKAILDFMPGSAPMDGEDSMVDGEAFFGGSGGDDTLSDALKQAGWRYVWSEAAYWWAMRSPAGEILTYVEGDVYRGDRNKPGGN